MQEIRQQQELQLLEIIVAIWEFRKYGTSGRAQRLDNTFSPFISFTNPLNRTNIGTNPWHFPGEGYLIQKVTTRVLPFKEQITLGIVQLPFPCGNTFGHFTGFNRALIPSKVKIFWSKRFAVILGKKLGFIKVLLKNGNTHCERTIQGT